jgi:hypothetical protein
VRRRQQQFSLVVTLAILIPIAALVVYFAISSRMSSAADGSIDAGPTTATAGVLPNADGTLPTAQPSPSSTAGAALSPAATGVAKPAAATGALAIAPNQPLRLRIAPSGPCWVRVSVDGQVRHQALMQKGEVYQQDAKDGFEILIGDAGTFRYSINDRPGRIVGESGDVITARINRSTLDKWLEATR